MNSGDTYTGDDAVQPPLTNTGPGPSNEYTVFFSGTDTEKVLVHHKADEHTKIYFINSDATAMRVKIDFVNAPGNFRLNQIIMPDGSMDGPFGTDTTYDLTQHGGYQLIFHESMMAGDPRTGDATITIQLLR